MPLTPDSSFKRSSYYAASSLFKQLEQNFKNKQVQQTVPLNKKIVVLKPEDDSNY